MAIGTGLPRCRIAMGLNKILKAKQQGHDTTGYEREIDELVYKLYNLTEEEIKIVEGR